MRVACRASATPPSPREPDGDLQARLRRLQEAQRRSQELLRAARDAIGGGSAPAAAKRTRRREAAHTDARAAMAKRLSAANGYARHLERKLKDKEDVLLRTKRSTRAGAAEVARCLQQAGQTHRSLVDGDVREAMARCERLQERLRVLQESMEAQEQEVDLVRVRQVPVEWHGMAQDVCVMGSFDNWTKGVHMSPEYSGSHNVFRGELLLMPGRYEIKFLVDGVWHLAPHWPATVQDPLLGNNILIVE